MNFEKELNKLELPILGFVKDGIYFWGRINIPKSERRKGKAKKSIKSLCKCADVHGVTISCYAIPDQGSRSKFARKWIKVLHTFGFEVDALSLMSIMNLSYDDIIAMDKRRSRDELIRYPKKIKF